jgi:hypothetical protein
MVALLPIKYSIKLVRQKHKNEESGTVRKIWDVCYLRRGPYYAVNEVLVLLCRAHSQMWWAPLLVRAMASAVSEFTKRDRRRVRSTITARKYKFGSVKL